MTPLHLNLLDLEEGQCRFPFGDGPQYLFCGCPTQEGSSYCAEHHALTNLPVRPFADVYVQRGGRKVVAA